MFFVANAFSLNPIAILLFVLGIVFGNPNIQNKVGNWSVVQNSKLIKFMLKQIIKKVEDPKQLESAIEKSLGNKSQILAGNNKMQETFVESVNEVAEICLGKILMLVFDECE